MAALIEAREQLARLGISLAAIGSGSPEQARKFIVKTGFTGKLYTSPDLAAYRAFGLVRGRWRTLGPAAVLRAIRALGQGFRRGSTAGDHWQQGGLFLLDTGGRVLFAHRDRFAGDHADMKNLSTVLESHFRV